MKVTFHSTLQEAARNGFEFDDSKLKAHLTDSLNYFQPPKGLMISLSSLTDAQESKIKNSNHFSFPMHFRYSMEMSIASHKLHHVYNAILSNYPEKIYKSLPNTNNHINKLRDLMDSQVFEDFRNIEMPHKAKCIYFEGIGPKVIEQLGLNYSIVPVKVISKKKSGLTPAQYKAVVEQLLEIHNFFYFLQVSILVPYKHNKKLQKQAQKVVEQIDLYIARLAEKLKIRHQDEWDAYQYDGGDRAFLAHSLIPTDECEEYLVGYMKALLTCDHQSLSQYSPY